MKFYTRPTDATLGMVLLLEALAAIFMILGSLWHSLMWLFVEMPLSFIAELLLIVPYLVLIVMIFVFRHHLFRGHVPRWGYLGLLAATFTALWFACGWFIDPMHDIGLLFDSHGRWGCRMKDESGANVYFIRDNTAPWLLYGPLILVITGHWFRSRRRSAAPTI